MKSRLRFIAPALVMILAIYVYSCSKSNGSKPTLSIKSIQTLVDSGANLTVVLNYGAGSGKLGGGTFTSIRLWQNQKPPMTPSGNDTLKAGIPSVTGGNKGELVYTYLYTGYLNEGTDQNDSLKFKLAVTDGNGNKSDTITSPLVVVFAHPR